MIYKEKSNTVDEHRIDPKNSTELRYWSVVLRTNADTLRKAIKIKGNTVADVKKFLFPDQSKN